MDLPSKLTWLKELNEKRINDQRSKNEEAELADCTFNPKIKALPASLLNEKNHLQALQKK